MIYKRQPQVHSLPTNYNKIDAESQYMLSDFKGLQVFDNPLLADLKSTYNCKNVYVDETKTLTVRPRIKQIDGNTTRIFKHTASGVEKEFYWDKSAGTLEYNSGGVSFKRHVVEESNVIFFDDYNQAYFLIQRKDNNKLQFIDGSLSEVPGDTLLADSANDIDRFNILNDKVILNKYLLGQSGYVNLDEAKFSPQFQMGIFYAQAFETDDLLVIVSDSGGEFQIIVYDAITKTRYVYYSDIEYVFDYYIVELGRDSSSKPFVKFQTVKHSGMTTNILYQLTIESGKLTGSKSDLKSPQTPDDDTRTYLIPESDDSKLWVHVDYVKHKMVVYRQNNSGTTEILKIVADLDENLILGDFISNGSLLCFLKSSTVYNLKGQSYNFGIYNNVIPTSVGLLGLNTRQLVLLQNSGNFVRADLAGYNIDVSHAELIFADATYIHIDTLNGSTILWNYATGVYHIFKKGNTKRLDMITANYGYEYNNHYVGKVEFEFRETITRELTEVPALASIADKPITGFYLDGFWWFITEHHVFGSGANGEGQLTIEYWDPYKYFSISEKITGAMRVSDTSFWVFHNNGAYLIYKASSPDESGRYLWLSTPVAKFKGCDFENATAVLPVSNYTCVVTDDDISIVQLRENVQSDDRVLVPMTTRLSALVSEILNETESVLIGNYKYLSLFFCNPTEKTGSVPILVYDNAQDNWWYWEIPVNEVKQILPGTPLQFITDKGSFEFAEDYIDNLYCDSLPNNTQIEWYWQSAVQLFGNLTNRKQLLQTLFTLCDVGENDSNLDYQFIIYSKEIPDETTKTFTETLTYRIKNNTVRTLISSFTYLQIQLSNSKTASEMSMDTNSVMTRPKLVSMIFKFRNLQGGIT